MWLKMHRSGPSPPLSRLRPRGQPNQPPPRDPDLGPLLARDRQEVGLGSGVQALAETDVEFGLPAPVVVQGRTQAVLQMIHAERTGMRAYSGLAVSVGNAQEGKNGDGEDS